MAKKGKVKNLQLGIGEQNEPMANNPDGINDATGTTLQISAKDQKPLSKSQQAFNKLTKQIEKLEQDIENESKKLDKLSDIYNNEISVLEAELAQEQMSMAQMLDAASEKIKFNKSQRATIGEAIVQICNIAFCKLTPSPEQEALFDKWSDTTYKEELERQENESESEFASFFEDFLGIKIEDDEGNPLDAESIKNAFEEKMSGNKQKFKSKKQLMQEEALHQEQELKNKNIRSIYISLAKVLHPDAETDPEAKSSKEQIMKQVTVAYEQKDLKTLLHLEMEWIHKTTEHLAELSEDKLSTYIAVLKEQVAQLKQDKYALRHNPRYQPIQNIAYLTEKQAEKELNKLKNEFKSSASIIQELTASISASTSKTDVVNLAKAYTIAVSIMNKSSNPYCDDDDDYFY